MAKALSSALTEVPPLGRNPGPNRLQSTPRALPSTSESLALVFYNVMEAREGL